MSEPAKQCDLPIAVIVLAAGLSTRLGQPKQMLRHNGESLLRRAVRTAIASGVGPVFVVLSEDDAKSPLELTGFTVTQLFNDRPQTGMGRSIRIGIEALRNRSVGGAILATCDQLAVTPEHIQRLARELRKPGTAAVASGYAGTAGVPAAFAATLFETLTTLPESAGAKLILNQLGSGVVVVPLANGEQDIDTADDLRRLR